MKRNIANFLPLKSSFLSCEKDAETIFRKLFVENQPHSDELKRLLVISAKDCLDNKTNEQYNAIVKEMSIKMLNEKGYLRLEPKLDLSEHEQVKSYIRLVFDNFIPNATNPEFRDCNVTFDVICHTDYWDIGNFRSRPLKICGYIDGILNKAKLSGIGILNFTKCYETVLDENLSGYSLVYRAVHWTEDRLEDAE